MTTRSPKRTSEKMRRALCLACVVLFVFSSSSHHHGIQQQQQQHHHHSTCSSLGFLRTSFFGSPGLFVEGAKISKRKRRRTHNNKDDDPFFSANRNQSLNGTDLFNALFPRDKNKKPRNVIQGFVQGMRSALIGTGLALISIIGIPILGFQRMGGMGLLGGSLAGMLYAAIFTVVGYGHAVYQFWQGLIATPKAFWASHVQGKVWNEQTFQYEDYYLDKQAKELKSPYANDDDADNNNNSNTTLRRRDVADMTYYNLLQVPTTASSKQIKRAYYRQARDTHPDKNQKNEDATEQFRQLHLAYVTLYDEEKRSKYDRYGIVSSGNNKDGSGDGNPLEFDPFVFYGVVFNSQTVEPYIGELTIASFTDQILHMAHGQQKQQTPEELFKQIFGIGGSSTSAEHKKYKREKRQVEIALFLRNKVESFVNGTLDVDEFRALCRQEALNIVTSNPLFGPQFLETIGKALTLEAQQYLGFRNHHWSSIPGLVQGTLAVLRKKTHRFARIGTTTKKMFNLFRLAVETHIEQKNSTMPTSGEKWQEEEKYLIQRFLPAVLEMAWAYNSQDISATLHGACRKLFLDAGNVNSKFKRLQRAEAIELLGQEFWTEGQTRLAERKRKEQEQKNATMSGTNSSSEEDRLDDAESLMARLEVAFQVSHMKFTGQDTPDSETLIKEHQKQQQKQESNSKRSKPKVPA